jgi:hypothetical protein
MFTLTILIGYKVINLLKTIIPMEQLIGDLLKITIPAAMILYAMYLVVKSFLTKDFERRLIDIRVKNNEIVMPIRLQAYERMSLYLERITLQNIVLRVNEPSYTVGELQQILLMEIRNELNHNLSQQVYMSDVVWKLIKKSTEDTISIINNSTSALPRDAKSIELVKVMFHVQQEMGAEPTAEALRVLKEEIRKSF